MIEIPNIRSIRLETETRTLLEEVASSVNEINQKRPFSHDVNIELQNALLPERIVATLNMEGILVDLRQTRRMMDARTVEADANKSEIELRNALEANEFIVDQADRRAPLDHNLLREVNRLVLNKIAESAGQYRTEFVEISGASFQPPNPTAVHGSVEGVLGNLADSIGVDPIVRAAYCHALIAYIHPFEDGNGRTARMLQDFLLISDGYMPVGVPNPIRSKYYELLSKSDDGDWNGLIGGIAQRELEIISKANAIISSKQQRSLSVQRIAAIVKSKKQGTEYKKYAVWAKRFLYFRSILAQTASELTAASEEITIAHHDQEVIDFQKWKLIREKGAAPHTWFFTQHFYVEGEARYKMVFYFKRHMLLPIDPFRMDTSATNVHGHSVDVSLFCAGGRPAEEYNFYQYEDKDVRLREVLIRDDQVYAYLSTGEKIETKSGGSREKLGIKRYESPQEIVDALYGDIFMRKAGLG